MSTHQSLPKPANAKKKSDILPIPAQSKSHPVVAQAKIESTLSNEEQLAQMRANREASERMGSTLLIPESVPHAPPPVQPKLTKGQENDHNRQEADIEPQAAPIQSHPVVAQPKIESTRSNEEQLAQMRANREASERMGTTLLTPESVPRTLPPVQPKLTIGQPNDQYEQEADRVARQVVDQINAPPKIQAKTPRNPMSVGQRKPSPLAHHPAMTVQRYGTGGEMDASSDLESSIQRARGGGQPLGDGIRERMEGAFGADFSGVRVHTDGTSDQLNQSIQAKAFTTGQDVFFRSGAYDPGSRGGQELLAHELTHVVQQSGGQISETPTLVNNVAIQSTPLSSRSFCNLGTRSGETPIQRIFYWDNADQENVGDQDHENKNGLKVFTNKGELRKEFLSYCDSVLQENGIDVKLTQIQQELLEGFEGETEYSLGNKADNLVDPVVGWLVRRFKAKNPKELETKDPLFQLEKPQERKQWLPPAQEGEPSEQPGRLMNRGMSFAEGMLHQPQFVFSGQNVTGYTQVNDNATYSIGAYTVGGTGHLLGGSKSGERFGSDEAVKEMHAEEQQIAAFEDQVAKNAHGLQEALGNQTVILHLHISKSPCSERCQGIFNTLLTKYLNLQIQMYLEIPYMANDPEKMIQEARSLKTLMENYPGRLAYKVVSVHNANEMMKSDQNPVLPLGELAKFIYHHIQNENKNPQLASSRLAKFADLVKNKALPPQGFVSGLQQI